MSPRTAFGMTLYLVLCVGQVLPVNALAAQPEPFATWTLQYPGTHTLVWYFETRQNYERNEPNRAVVDDIEFLVYPGVRPPTLNGIYMLEYAKVKEGEEVLDIGTGTGLHAIFAAAMAKRVVATDIVPAAVVNAKFNATRLGLDRKIDFRVGDLFKPVKNGEKFDVFFININFPFATEKDDRTTLHERFFAEVRQYMKPTARIYYQTSFIENFPTIYDMLKRHRFQIMEMHMAHVSQDDHEPMFMMIQSLDEAKESSANPASTELVKGAEDGSIKRLGQQRR